MSRAQLTSTVEQNTGGVISPYVAGKNKFLNSDFSIWQRGVGTFTKITGNEVYTADRWVISNDAGTITCAQQTFTPGTAPVAGYEGQYFARITTTASSSNALYLIQKIEDVRSFAGQTVTLSYWAKVSSGTVTNSPLAIQAFGSGGSGDVVTSLSSSTITTAWTRFTHTVAIPSISGKTVGTSSSLQMQVLRVGVSATIDIWGVQIEAGSVATAFTTATGTLSGELMACQRYYYRIAGQSYQVLLANTVARSTGNMYGTMKHPVTMRTQPSFGSSTVNSTDFNIQYAGSDVTVATLGSLLPNTTSIGLATGGSGFTVGQGGLVYIAAGATSAWVDVSAEL